MRLVITGGLLLVQAVNDASTRINTNKTKVNFFTAYPFPYLAATKNPLALQNEGNLKLFKHASHPLFSAEVSANPEAGVLTSPTLLRVTAGGTMPDFHWLAAQLSPRSRLGTLGLLFDFL